MSETTKPANRLLAALPDKEYERLLPKLEEISLTYAETIYEPGDIIRRVYFPNSGIVSLLSTVEERSPWKSESSAMRYGRSSRFSAWKPQAITSLVKARNCFENKTKDFLKNAGTAARCRN